MNPLAVAIVGSGVISHIHAAAILRHPRLRLVAAVDPDPSANAALSDAVVHLGAPAPAAYADLGAALAQSTVDVIVICSPSGTHADIAEAAVRSGRHVVVEKPLDAGLVAARQFAGTAAVATGSGQLVSVISQHRFDPASVAVRDAVTGGRFGELTSAVASVPWWRGQEYYDSAGWRGTWALDGGGATMNQGVHTVDLLVWLLGQPVEVYARTARLAHDAVAVEDVAVATVQFSSGAVAVLHATTAAYPGLGVRLQIHGTHGSAVIHDDQLEYFHAGDAARGVGSRGEGGVAANQAADVVAPEELHGASKRDDAFVVGHLRQYCRHRRGDRPGPPARRDGRRRVAGDGGGEGHVHLGDARPANRGGPGAGGQVRRHAAGHRGLRHMMFSVFTASTPEWAPAEAARVLATQGWDGVEWRVTDQADAATPGFWAGNRATWPLTGIEDRLADIARISRDAGLRLSALGGYVRAGDRSNVERMLAVTAALEAERVRVTMPNLGEGAYRELFTAARADVAWVARRAAEHGVRAMIELHHRTIVASASASMRLVDGLDPAHIGVIHDIGNLVIEGYEDPLSAFQMLGEYLAHVHVKNVAWRPTGVGPDGAAQWREDWASLRDGQANLEAYFGALHAHGYDGWVTVEDFSTSVPLERRTADNLAYLRALRARVWGSP